MNRPISFFWAHDKPASLFGFDWEQLRATIFTGEKAHFKAILILATII